jgi:hypothetical protein
MQVGRDRSLSKPHPSRTTPTRERSGELLPFSSSKLVSRQIHVVLSTHSNNTRIGWPGIQGLLEHDSAIRRWRWSRFVAPTFGRLQSHLSCQTSHKMAALRTASQCFGRRPNLQLSFTHHRGNSEQPLLLPRKFQVVRQLSLTTRQQSSKQSTPKPAKANGSNAPPELPSLSLDSLGVSPRMKTFLIVLLCIFGTIETFTWTMFLYNRFYKKEEEQADDDAEK